MQITKLEDGAAAPKTDTKVFTQEELQKEFDFMLAERIVRKMAEKGLISDNELHKISEKNRFIFSPYICVSTGICHTIKRGDISEECNENQSG